MNRSEASQSEGERVRAYVGELNAKALADAVQQIRSDISMMDAKIIRLEQIIAAQQREIMALRVASVPKTIGPTA